MALGIAPALISQSIRLLIGDPNVSNLRIARARVQQGRGGSLVGTLAPARSLVGAGLCWLQAQSASQSVIRASLPTLRRSIRDRVPTRTGRAKRSVKTGRGHPQLPIVYHFEFDVGVSEEYYCGIDVPYAPYLRNVDDWFFDICEQWYEDTASRALQAFLVFYVRCARRSS